MRDHWTLSLGRYAGIPIRLHASCLVCGLGAMYVASQASRGTPDADLTGYGALAAFIWFASLLVHEVGHLAMAARVGAPVERIVIGPLGDLVPISLPHDPRRELMIALAGPLAHLVVLLIVTPALWVSNEDIKDLLLSPLSPTNLTAGGVWAAALRLWFWCNWLLLLVNFLPALPLDAGRALWAGLRPVLGERNATLMVARAGALVSILGLGIWSLFANAPGALVPAWLPLTLVGLFLYFSARTEISRLDDEDRDGELLGYDFSQGYTSLEKTGEPIRRREPGVVQRWVQQRRELKQRRIRQLEEEEERRVDEVLARVKDVGLGALTPEERALLHRVSARYRNRQSH
jgi:Zn-dependent protease